MKHLHYIIAITILLLSALSCKTLQTEYIYQNSTDTLYIAKYQIDSIIMKDSIILTGDTIYKIHWRTKIHNKIDTIYKSVTDTLIYNKTQTVTETKNSKFATVCIVFSIIVILLLIVRLILYVRKKLF